MRFTIFATILAILTSLANGQPESRSLSTNLLKLVFSGPQVDPQPASKEEGQVSLLETISLSYAGNFDLADTIRQGRNIVTSIVRALSSFIDLKTVRSIVEVTIGSFLPPDADNLPQSTENLPHDSENEVDTENAVGRGRSGLIDLGNTEAIKDGITMLVGAVIGQQECWQKTACKAGEYARSIPGKDFLLIFLERFVPTSWSKGLSAARASATYKQDCGFYECSADPEGTEDDA